MRRNRGCERGSRGRARSLKGKEATNNAGTFRNWLLTRPVRCRVNFRRAKLAAKKSLTQAQRLERELMVQSYSLPVSEVGTPDQADDKVPPLPQIPRHNLYNKSAQHQTSSLSEKDRQAVGASSRVTDSLRQMHASLQAELERSEYANQTMKESSAAFQQLHESYSSLEVMLTSSRDLLGTLLRSQKSDTWYLTTTFYMLLTVGAWLLFRRLLYGPMWWLVWLPLRMLLGVGSKVGNAALQGREESGESARVEVGGTDGKVPIEGMPGKDLPTAQVGQEGNPPDGDPDSMVDRVGKVVDAVNEADELGSIPKDGEEGSGAREARQGVEEERPRDEL